MTLALGNVQAGTVIYIPFATYGKVNGESITMTGFGVADIRVYKNGSITERNTTAGFTLLDTDGIDFDGNVGIHGFSIDLNNNTDAGFFVAGSTYWVVINSVTVDGAVINFVAAHFKITDYTEIADALLNRDMALGADPVPSGATNRTPKQALRALRNKWSVVGSTLTVTKEDDTTTSWSAAVTGTAGANPITTVDPT